MINVAVKCNFSNDRESLVDADSKNSSTEGIGDKTPPTDENGEQGSKDKSYMKRFREYLQKETEDDQEGAAERAYVRLYSELTIDEVCAVMEYRQAKAKACSDDDDDATKAYNNLSMIKSMTKMVGKRIQLSERKTVLEKMTSTQNAITYLLYIVFTLNAFLTGFGLA